MTNGNVLLPFLHKTNQTIETEAFSRMERVK